MLVIGCVSIVPATPTTRPVPASPVISTLAPLPAPSAVATATATATPASTPTLPPATTPAQPTPAQDIPPAPPSAQASPAGVENYGASTPLFNDGFDDPESGWGIGTNDGGSVSFGESSLEIDTSSEGAWESTSRLTGTTSNAMQLETIFTRTGSGFAGLLCANSDNELWGAVADENGNYQFVKVGPDGATALMQGQLDSLKTPSNAMDRFGLDCAGTKTGSFKMQLFAPGTNEGVQYFARVDEGPTSFDRVGIYAESIAEPFSLSMDYVLAFGGTGDTSMSADAKELLTHVPTEWQPLCFESFASAFVVGAKGDLFCQLNSGTSDYAEYTSFDNQADMDASFQNMVTRWAVPETGVLCDTGAHLGTYSIGGQTAGQVLCAPAITGTQFFWTDNNLRIMSQLSDLEGSYPDMYSDWLQAGPN